MMMATKVLSNEEQMIEKIKQSTTGLKVDVQPFQDKAFRMVPENASNEKINEILIKNALENIDEASTDWTYVASRIYLSELYDKAASNRNYDAQNKYGDFYSLLQILTEKGIYSASLLDKYTKTEIDDFAKEIRAERDLLFDYL